MVTPLHLNNDFTSQFYLVRNVWPAKLKKWVLFCQHSTPKKCFKFDFHSFVWVKTKCHIFRQVVICSMPKFKWHYSHLSKWTKVEKINDPHCDWAAADMDSMNVPSGYCVEAQCNQRANTLHLELSPHTPKACPALSERLCFAFYHIRALGSYPHKPSLVFTWIVLLHGSFKKVMSWPFHSIQKTSVTPFLPL